jgi:hypothetical protein
MRTDLAFEVRRTTSPGSHHLLPQIVGDLWALG